MKNTIFTIGVLAILTMVSCEKDKASNLFSDAEKQELASNVVDPATAAELKFETPSYDLGELPEAAKVDHYVKFTNTGKSPLIIKKAVGSCGCTVPEWPKDPIAPGASDSLKISYNAQGKHGKQTNTVTLTTNTINGTEKWTFSATLPLAATPQ
jgi:hypothetical protein